VAGSTTRRSAGGGGSESSSSPSSSDGAGGAVTAVYRRGSAGQQQQQQAGACDDYRPSVISAGGRAGVRGRAHDAAAVPPQQQTQRVPPTRHSANGKPYLRTLLIGRECHLCQVAGNTV